MENESAITVEEVVTIMKENDYFFSPEQRIESLKKLLTTRMKKTRKNISSRLCSLQEDFSTGAHGHVPLASGYCGLLTSDGFVVTNNHLIENTQRPPQMDLRLISSGRDTDLFDPLIRVTLPQHDLALLRLLRPNWSGRPVIKLAQNGPKIGQHLIVQGPENKHGKVLRKSDCLQSEQGEESFEDTLVTDIVAQKGWSGSPVLNKEGALAAVCSYGMQLPEMMEMIPTGLEHLDIGFLGIRKIKYVRMLIEKALEEIPQITF